MFMKSIELKIVSELMKNSHRSDRELARRIGTSQPTVTRVRTRLESALPCPEIGVKWL